MAGKKKNNNHKQNPGGGKQSKKAERDMRKLHRRKRDRVKYGGEKWNADFKKLNEQLTALGLTIKDVAGDGNCLFRAIADQLDNNASKHFEHRATITSFMEKNRDMFEPFLDAEDDGSFEEYLSGMRDNGTWGGNLEIQAASLSLRINIIIYQLDQPRWEVVNFADAKTKTIQLSYLDGDHYASVIPLDTNNVVTPHATTIPTHLTTTTTTKPTEYIQPPNDFEKSVMDSSGNQDITEVRKVLEEHEWDTDSTIAYLMTISESNLSDTTSANGAELDSHGNDSEGHLHKKLSKISKHIPHHPHIHHKETKAKGKKNKRGQKENVTNNPVVPVNPEVAIKEMGALSI